MKSISTHADELREQYEEDPLGTTANLFLLASAVLLPFETLLALYLTTTNNYTLPLFVPIIHGICVVLVAVIDQRDLLYILNILGVKAES